MSIKKILRWVFGFDPRWKPIETAPRDGTSVLVCEPGGGMNVAHFAHWYKPGLWATYTGDTIRPTHWMECPEWPKEILRESEGS
jgi:hypothetical protein